MQFARLLALDKPIFRARNDDYRHVQVLISILECTSGGDHQS
jgi:hypothetical protein